jgi:Na+/H+ antiporter NhaC
MNLTSQEWKHYLKVYGILAVVFAIIVILVPNDPAEFGLLSVIPAAFLLIFIFYTKRVMESLLLGATLGYLMAYKGDFFGPVNDSLYGIMLNESIAWLFIVCGLMGSIIALIEKAGGAFAFGEWVSKRAKTRRSTLVWTWMLGVVIFMDDYLNCLTVGSSMSPLTDRHKVPRELLAYVVDSTAAPVCVLIPISTWAVFIGSLMEENEMAPAGEGLKYFIQTIPYNFYAWFAVIVVLLVAMGWFPIIGPMKKAIKRAEETGVLAPPGSEKIDMKAGELVPDHSNAKLASFFLPLIVLVVSTMLYDIDMQKGVITTLAFIFVYYIGTGILGPEEYMDQVIKGIKNMLFPMLLVVAAYFFAAASEEIGFIGYMISLGEQFITPATLPLVVFLTFGITEFIMGISWGMYVIALPIVIPLAMTIGANPFIAVGAVCSAGVWGSHICFYSDATILTSAATGCDNYRHAITQMPYGFVGMVFSAIAFFIVGQLGIGI